MSDPPPAPPPWRPRGETGPAAPTAPDDFERTVVQPLPTPPPMPPMPPAGYHPTPAPARRSPFVTGVLVCASVFAGVVVVGALLIWFNGDRERAASTGSPLADAVIAPTSTAPPTTAGPPPGTSTDAPAPVGSDVTPAQGWTVRVTGTELNANATMAATNMLARPGRGRQFVIVSLAIDRTGTRAGTLGEMKASLRSSDGTSHDPYWLPPPDGLQPFTQVAPGTTETGAIVFEVPSGTVNGALLVAEPLVSLTPGRDKRYLAIQ